MRLIVWSALVAVMASPAASAQEPSDPVPPAEGGDIVVTTDRQAADQLSRQLRLMTSQHEGQLTRFQVAVCPSVHGLPQDRAEQVAARIIALAATTGLPAPKPDCKPNLMVVIAADGPGFIAGLKQSRPEAFAMMHFAAYRKLRSERGPAWSWQSIEPRRSDGAPVQYISEFGGGSGPPQRLPKGAYQVPGAQLSRLSEPVRFDVGTAWVVIDLSGAVGLTPRQIGDYAGLVALTGARASSTQQPPRPSILRLFSDRANQEPAEEEATAFDLAFLRARYSGSAAQSADWEFRRMAVSLTQDEDGAAE
jgi:hypothetical protein